MSGRLQLIVFDVNETLSDLRPMAQRFADIGAPAGLAATWFAAVLRDGFALTVAGSTARFADLAVDVLRTERRRSPKACWSGRDSATTSSG